MSLKQNLRCLLHHKVPGQLIIQITDRCNALCPQCGMRANNIFRRSVLEPDSIKRIIDTAAAEGFESVSFTGGEPFLLSDRLIELIDYASRAGIRYIRTGTNGYIFRDFNNPKTVHRAEYLIDRLAGTNLRNFWISIDSFIPDEHENIRGLKGVIQGIEKALPKFHERGIYPSANLGITRRIAGDLTARLRPEEKSREEFRQDFFYVYRDALRRFYGFVTDLGFTMASTCYPMSMETADPDDGLSAVYAATSEEDIVSFNREEKALLFQVLLEVIPEFRSRIRLFSPKCSVYAMSLDEQGSDYHCRGGKDFFFIDASSGQTFPCGYRGKESMGMFWEQKWQKNGHQTKCTACEWECFRDPSYLFGPLLEGFRAPARLLKRIREDQDFFRFWWDDIRYYFACDFFNGRKAPNYQKLARCH